MIIPCQRELVRAKREGRPPDPVPGARGKQRSVHNTYFTLPVLFVMISGHYAMTYGARSNWLILIAMCFAGACIRAWFVARHRADERGGKTAALPALLGALTLIAVGVALVPTPDSRASGSRLAPRSRIARIIEERCEPCHARRPTEPGFAEPPNGLVLETTAQVRLHLPQVQRQLTTRQMPLGNLTNMSAGERTALLNWVDHGAPK